MNILGVRCSNTDYAFAILTGEKESPIVINARSIAFPKGYNKSERLKWFLQEIDALLSKHNVGAIVVKSFEGQHWRSAVKERMQYEAIVFLSGANCGLKRVCEKRNASIAKDLGLKGQAHYLSTNLNTSVVANFDNYPEKTREAILAAWSELP
jgi:Holliday junction resolvasome RuvABC endonuclease subunit